METARTPVLVMG